MAHLERWAILEPVALLVCLARQERRVHRVCRVRQARQARKVPLECRVVPEPTDWAPLEVQVQSALQAPRAALARWVHLDRRVQRARSVTAAKR